MLDAALGGALQPVGGAFRDVELAVGIVGAAVAAGLVVGAGAVDGAVVLGDVEIQRPGAQGVGHDLVGGPEFVVAVAFLEEGGLGGVVAHEVEIGVGEIRLETDDAGHGGGLQSVHCGFPRVEAAPAYFTFRRDALTELLGDLSGFAECLGDPGGVAGDILCEIGGAACGIDTDDARLADTMLVEDFRDAAGLLHGEDKIFGILIGAKSRAADRSRPDGSHQRTYGKSF